MISLNLRTQSNKIYTYPIESPGLMLISVQFVNTLNLSFQEPEKNVLSITLKTNMLVNFKGIKRLFKQLDMIFY